MMVVVTVVTVVVVVVFAARYQPEELGGRVLLGLKCIGRKWSVIR